MRRSHCSRNIRRGATAPVGSPLHDEFRPVTPAAIIDFNRILDLGYIRADAAMVRIER
jgi:hypothetical protein